VRLRHRIVGLVGGPRPPAVQPADPGAEAPAAPSAADPGADTPEAPSRPVGWPGVPHWPDLPGGPGAVSAADLAADPCAAQRTAVDDACSLADRLGALAVASQERLRDARRNYDEHSWRREQAANAADPRAVRAAKDEAQAAFRRARLGAHERTDMEAAAREWLREIDRVNARTREAIRIVSGEDAVEAKLLGELNRLGVEADGARIAAESAGEACRNARITLASCEERERVAASATESVAPSVATLAPASVAARATVPAAGPPTAQPAGATTLAGESAPAPAAASGAEWEAGEPADAPSPATEPAIIPLLAGDRAVARRLAATLAGSDAEAERTWLRRLGALVEAVRGRAIDSAALVFPEDHPFWGPYTQLQCREIAAALAALGFRLDGDGGFADGRVPGQRELSLAIGYAGLDPMRVRIWPRESELPDLYAGVEVDAGRFVSEAAGELTLGEMIDMLGRRAEDLGDLWNAWGRVRPLLLEPA
jgi:hypothetical protein